MVAGLRIKPIEVKNFLELKGGPEKKEEQATGGCTLYHIKREKWGEGRQGRKDPEKIHS